MNFIDFMAILPLFLSLLLEGLEDMQVGFQLKLISQCTIKTYFQIIGKAGKVIRLVRVMRIMRVFKLVRHFAGLQSLAYTLQQVPSLSSISC